MHVALAYVSSLDGKIAKTDGSLVRDWASKEDGAVLTKLISHFEVVVLGRTAYEQIHPGLHEDRLYLVLTHHPEQFAEEQVAGQREFLQALPSEVLDVCRRRGLKKVLLLTGSEISSSFLAANLVDELYLTIEPLLFGNGQPMLGEHELHVRLRLDSVARLNTQGTLLAHYVVEKPALDSRGSSS